MHYELLNKFESTVRKDSFDYLNSFKFYKGVKLIKAK